MFYQTAKETHSRPKSQRQKDRKAETVMRKSGVMDGWKENKDLDRREKVQKFALSRDSGEMSMCFVISNPTPEAQWEKKKSQFWCDNFQT